MSEEEIRPEEEAGEQVSIELVQEKPAEETVETVAPPEVEEEEEAELEYDISDPTLLDVMLQVTELLEKVARNQVSISEAKAEYNIIVSRLSDVAKKKVKTRKKSTKKKSSGSKRRKKKASGGGEGEG